MDILDMLERCKSFWGYDENLFTTIIIPFYMEMKIADHKKEINYRMNLITDLMLANRPTTDNELKLLGLNPQEKFDVELREWIHQKHPRSTVSRFYRRVDTPCLLRSYYQLDLKLDLLERLLHLVELNLKRKSKQLLKYENEFFKDCPLYRYDELQ